MILPRVLHVISRQLHSGKVLYKYVEATSVRYPHLKRGKYSVLTEKDVSFFQKLLAPHQVLTEPDDVAGYNVDWMHSVRGIYNT